jgi:hypothetical protein
MTGWDDGIDRLAVRHFVSELIKITSANYRQFLLTFNLNRGGGRPEPDIPVPDRPGDRGIQILAGFTVNKYNRELTAGFYRTYRGERARRKRP